MSKHNRERRRKMDDAPDKVIRTKFAEAMASNPPRLVVRFRRGADGEEQFEWGVVGAIPLLSLIGALARVQAELVAVDEFRAVPKCDEQALVLVWDDATRSTSWFVHPDVPVDPMLGMLEAIKEVLVSSRKAQQVAAPRLLSPNGGPLRR